MITTNHKQIAWKVIWITLVVQVLAVLCWYPDILTVIDELSYVRTAQAYANGSLNVPIFDQFIEHTNVLKPKEYAPGTSLIMTPFVALFGWRGAFLVPLFALILSVWLTARWLEEEGYSPLFALTALLFFPTMIMVRIAMSDVLSGLFVIGSIFTFWRGLDEKHRSIYWCFSGFLAGLSFIVRESNPLLLAPFFVGALLRRDRGVIFLLLGGMVGVACRLIVMWLFVGEAFGVRGHDSFSEIGSSLFGLEYILPHTLFYALILTVFAPLGLPCVFAYRARRWPELVSSVFLFILLYASYYWIGNESGFAKSLVLGGRFMIPLVPILAFAMGSVLPRWFKRLRFLVDKNHIQLLNRVAIALILIATTCIVVVNYTMYNWSSSQREVRDLIYKNTEDGSVLLLGKDARKYVNELYGDRIRLSIDSNLESIIKNIQGSNQRVFVVIHDRYDSEFWRRHSEQNSALLMRFSETIDLAVRVDQKITKIDRLRILEVVFDETKQQ